ncbi:phosphodiester glycosidase family protein [Oceanirhabdus sp. W0125-5]|uniref:phosphodiester glycosidase family protein n=1 Tax=Oceanirhabdus sp. W0125-5 TaxID=2999116 RepID=UPI0022F3061A|nr:phosphodiester glycosidase family protein [Oceanirhabdus sp. W0125-5]WBW98722.1 phosphodiester glycosidase family protein [Oceanirhabdus sp. W0125-5]
MKKSIRNKLCCFSAMVFLFGTNVKYASGITVNSEYREIVNGIEYIEKEIFSDQNSKYKVNEVTIDLDNEDVGVIFAKEKKYALGKSELSNHVNEAIEQGNRVVAGINGDFFNVKAGISVGPHVEYGEILTSYTATSDRRKYPLIVQRKNKKISIEKLEFSGQIAVIKGNGIHDFPEELLDEKDILKTTFDSVNRYDEFHVNRYKMNNYITVLTPNYSEDRKLKKSSYAPNEVLVVLNNVVDQSNHLLDSGLKLDNQYRGEVVSIGGNEDGYIPENGVVIAASGEKAQWFKEHVEVGDQIKLKASFGDQEIERIIAAYSYLVEDGKGYNEEQLKEVGYQGGLLTRQRSRTALGIDKKGKLVAVTLEGGTAVNQYSDGASLIEFAQILEEMGLQTAVNLDGGGSTEVTIKNYAEEDFKIINRPEDGKERKISNSILFTTRNNKNEQKVHSISVKEPFVILKNSSVPLTVKGENKYGFEVNVDKSKVKWKVSDSLSNISNGIFNAGEANGLVMLEGEYDNKKAVSYAIVIDELDKVEINSGYEIYLNEGDEFQFKATGKSSYLGEIELNKNNIEWKLSGNIGSIDDNGKLKTFNSGIGIVYCSIGDKVTEVKVTVGQDIVEIDNFEEKSFYYEVDGFMGGKGSISQEKVYNGNNSLKISYDYSTWKKEYNGTINLKLDGQESKKASYGRPEYLSAMVYGDGKAPWMRASFTDANGEEFTVNMASEIDWIGWREVRGEIPSEVALPIKLEKIYFVETHKDVENKSGEVYLDDIMYIYNSSYKNSKKELTSKIEGIYPLNNMSINNGKFLIKAKLYDEVTVIDPYSIKVLVDGVEARFLYNEESKELIAVPDKVLKKGAHIITINAKNIYGESARRLKIDVNVE